MRQASKPLSHTILARYGLCNKNFCGAFSHPSSSSFFVRLSSSSSMSSSSSWLQNLPIDKVAELELWPPRNEKADFDWTAPTSENYNDNQDVKQFTPSFASARSRLDYTYHNNLVKRRQLLQDAILSRVTSAAKAPETSNHRPWICFTAGAMGVGKGYTITNLYRSGLFPLDRFLKIDPDMLKNELPEMAGYLLQDANSAATKLHRESTQMADVLFEYALLQRLPLLVDGSLRDVEFYETLFDRIHRDYPQYRIAILHIVATRDVIYKRAQERALRTGRVVPRSLLDASIEQVPRSVSILLRKADVTHVIQNNEGEPLELVSTKLGADETLVGMTWLDFKHSWQYSDRENGETKVEDASCLDFCTMSAAWNDADAHNAAHSVWGKAYPNFCPRCQLTCDGQCGICIHGAHRCACDKCNQQ